LIAERLLRSLWSRRASLIAALLLLPMLCARAVAGDREPLRGMYIVSGAFERGWRDGLGIPDVLATQNTFATALAAAIADTKRLGLNTLILDPSYYAGRSFGYGEYSEIAAQQATRGGIGLLIGMPVVCPAASPQCWRDPRQRNDMFLASCEDGPEQRAFVDRFAVIPAVRGFLCAYENFGQPNVTSSAVAALHSLTRYIQSKGKIYFDIPAAGLQHRVDGVFSRITPQLNPRLYSTPAAMRGEIAADAARYDGAEINFWHSETSPENGYPQGPRGTEKWHQLQYDAFIRVHPRDTTVFDYQKLIAERDGPLLFYRPRGWLMSLMARLDDRSLTFYDPLESAFSSVVMHAKPVDLDYRKDGIDALVGGGVDGGTAAVGRDGALLVPLTIPDQDAAPLLTIKAGTFAAWIKANWAFGPGEIRGILRMPCLAAGRDCLVLEVVGAEVRLQITDSDGVPISIAARLGAGWRRRGWNQLAASWDRAAGRLELYCNGGPIAHAAANWNSRSPSAGQLEDDRLVIANLGDRKPDSEHGLDGELDEVRLYARALSPDAINRLYRNFFGAGQPHEPR
jgi:Concanavalin A-like lectin/glucanases superfamily